MTDFQLYLGPRCSLREEDEATGCEGEEAVGTTLAGLGWG